MAADTPNQPTKSAKKPAGKVAKKPAEKITSKADLIRKVAGVIKAKGEKPRPKEIVRILKEEGVTVAPAQVSMTLKAAGYRPLRKRREGKEVRRGGCREEGYRSRAVEPDFCRRSARGQERVWCFRRHGQGDRGSAGSQAIRGLSGRATDI